MIKKIYNYFDLLFSFSIPYQAFSADSLNNQKDFSNKYSHQKNILELKSDHLQDSEDVLFINFKNDEKANINTYKNPILADGDIINVIKTILKKATEILNEVSNPMLTGYGLHEKFNYLYNLTKK